MGARQRRKLTLFLQGLKPLFLAARCSVTLKFALNRFARRTPGTPLILRSLILSLHAFVNFHCAWMNGFKDKDFSSLRSKRFRERQFVTREFLRKALVPTFARQELSRKRLLHRLRFFKSYFWFLNKLLNKWKWRLIEKLKVCFYCPIFGLDKTNLRLGLDKKFCVQKGRAMCRTVISGVQQEMFIKTLGRALYWFFISFLCL